MLPSRFSSSLGATTMWWAELVCRYGSMAYMSDRRTQAVSVEFIYLLAQTMAVLAVPARASGMGN